MVIAIDIGNSTTTVGLFDLNGTLLFRSGIATNRSTSEDQCALDLLGLFQLYRSDISAVSGAAISSEVPSVTAHMRGAVARLIGKPPLVMGPGTKTGLNIKSDLHNQLGSDIVACSVAALAKYPAPLIVVDMGTAVTMSYLRERTYEGCVIMPGVRVALEALSDTVDAMRAGVVYGNASMIDGMIARMEEHSAPAAKVVATGGSAPEVLQYCKREIVYDADLVLHGLYLIYQKNTEGRTRRA